ncbi:MAG: Fic family protein [Leptotrichiaceae bacterium]|jgi:Fic family protein|nr:Fic family protein [Leptotrichiaceae bacterium]MBP7026563.1 Fic family protein [Leptotrichiaceae bacterium]MBP9876124.1 Fic family protein [Leptotrichiaceae bacterium]
METKKSTINFDSIDVENNKYKEVKLNELLSKQLKKDLNIKWTYNSTGIEGNSYTLNQTRILLAEGITIGGKRLVEHLEIIGHSEAIEYLEDIIENNVELTEREIKNIHSLVTKDIENVNSGAYRNNAVYISGSKHIPPQPYLVSEKMEELMLWYNNESKNIHPIERAAILHGEFVSIHPFIDGNGRTARLLLNFELMKNNYPAIIIEIEEREKYFDALEVGNLSGNWDKFTEFVREKCEERIDYMNEFKISELKSRKWNKFKERLQDSDEEISEIVEDMKDDFTEHEIELLLSETGRDNDTKTKVK